MDNRHLPHGEKLEPELELPAFGIPVSWQPQPAFQVLQTVAPATLFMDMSSPPDK